MKTLCNKIKYAFAFEVDSITGGNITLKTGFSLKTLNIIGDAVVEEKFDTTVHGGLFVQTVTALIDPKTNDLKNIGVYPLIMELTYDDETIVWGSLEKPVRTTALKSGNDVANFEFSRKADTSDM